MTGYRVSIGLTTGMSNRTVTWLINNAESMGADGIWIGEDIGRGHDIFVLTALILASTHACRVGTAIVPVATHPVLELGRAAYSLQAIAPDRFVLGLGLGGVEDLQRRGIRIRRPVTLLREVVTTLRQLWADEQVSIDLESEGHVEGRLGVRPLNRTCPVFLGVRGPQMLRLAGALADGVILSGPVGYLAEAVRTVRGAARTAGRAEADVETVAWLPTIMGRQDRRSRLARIVVATIIADTPPSVLSDTDLDPEALARVQQAVRNSGPEAGAEHVTEEMVSTFAIAGSVDDFLDAFETLHSIGITEIVVGPPFSKDWRMAMTDVLHAARGR